MPPTKIVNHHDKCPSPQCASEEESLLVRQRLRNLLQLAIEIGLKEGLLGNQKDINQPATERRKIRYQPCRHPENKNLDKRVK
jgi:hypothetical protein